MIPEAINNIVATYDERNKRMVLAACALAQEALEGKVRGGGRPFFEHPLNVVSIIHNEIGLPADCVCALLLHEANRFEGSSAAELNSSRMLESFKAIFPEDIIQIVISLNNISYITLQETNLDEERYRKLLISYSTDPRVVLIKLADRLEVMRSLELLPPSKHNAKIMETAIIYTPLAHQLGLNRVQFEYEDIYLRYTEPEQYRSITNHLKATEPEREALAVKFIKPLEEKLKENGIKYTMKARTKSAYSIWKKMQAQKVPFEKIYDVFAMRFIIDCPPIREKEHELCWKVYSLVTEKYTPDTSRLRDWLSRPRPNGYESLHTTVTTEDGTAIEVQIRSVRMDVEAEQGHASHWSYKGIKSEESLSNWLNKVRDMLQGDRQTEFVEFSPIRFDNEVFVFTPTGDLRQLPKGATILDFAFDIHTNLGLKCTGGRINGKMVSIKEQLKTGDVVEIISGKNQHPAQDWLNFVVSTKAKSKIKQKLKEEEHKKAALGREMLERRLKNWKLEIGDEDLHYLAKKYKYKNLNDFFAALGEETINLMEIKDYLLDEKNKPAAESVVKEHRQVKESSSDYLVIGEGLNNVDYKLSRCCNPIFGDDVFGFVTIKDGIKIHRMSCPNAARLIENYPYRIQKVRWKESAGKSSFQVSLKVIVFGDASASSSVISTVGLFKASIRSFNVVDRNNGESEIQMQIYIPGNLELDKIVASLKKLREVKQVTRL